MERLSIHERRRRAPLHYLAKAENARFAAFCVWISMKSSQEGAPERVWPAPDGLADTIGYGGTPSIALYESFRREAAISLELIIKAVIAQRIEAGVAGDIKSVRMVHDLPRLWADAALPALSPPDVHRLLIGKSILYWSGRYAAPKKDSDYEKEEESMKGLHETTDVGIKLIKPRSFDWDDVDRIYQIADKSFVEVRRSHEERLLLPHSN